MGHELEPLGGSGGKDAGKFARRMALLGTVQPDPGNLVQPRLGLSEGGQCGLFGQVAQETEDQF